MDDNHGGKIWAALQHNGPDHLGLLLSIRAYLKLKSLQRFVSTQHAPCSPCRNYRPPPMATAPVTSPPRSVCRPRPGRCPTVHTAIIDCRQWQWPQSSVGAGCSNHPAVLQTETWALLERAGRDGLYGAAGPLGAGRSGRAVGQSSVILPHSALPLVGVSIGTERECQHNDRTLADGKVRPALWGDGSRRPDTCGLCRCGLPLVYAAIVDCHQRQWPQSPQLCRRRAGLRALRLRGVRKAPLAGGGRRLAAAPTVHVPIVDHHQL